MNEHSITDLTQAIERNAYRAGLVVGVAISALVGGCLLLLSLTLLL